MTNFAVVLGLSKGDEQFAVVNRTSEVHASLPELIFLLGGSSINQEFFDRLDDYVAEGGRLEGQSKRQPDQEEDILEADALENEFLRPNGEVYYARNWTGIQDVLVLRKCREAKQNPFLYGPPGTGKTALAEAAHGDEVVTFVFSGDTEVPDLVGTWVPNPLFGVEKDQPEYTWEDGPLTVAVENGRPFLADEIGLADAKVLSVMYPLMDGRGELRIVGNPARGIVKAAEGFYIIGATNPNAPGVNMSEALLSRFTVHTEVTTDWGLAITKLGIDETIVGLAEGLNRKLTEGALEWAPQMRELLAFRNLTQVFGLDFAIANLIATAPEGDREQVQITLKKVYGQRALAARI